MGAVRRKHIREVVSGVLAARGVASAPVDVEAIVTARGILICREPAADDLCGFLIRDKHRKRTIIGVNANHHRNRQRFTIAHEFAHYILHDSQPFHIDKINVGFIRRNRDSKSSEGTDVEEKEANLFAAELLMPKQFIDSDMLNLGDAEAADEETVVTNLAKRYDVSSQAFAFRLAYLGYMQVD